MSDAIPKPKRLLNVKKVVKPIGLAIEGQRTSGDCTYSCPSVSLLLDC